MKKAIILLATLKAEGLSNTETLVEFCCGYLKKQKIDCELVKLAEHNILPGTYTDMGEDDAWPYIYEKILEADIIIFATPIWWNNHSSELQRAIERLDEVYDMIQAGEDSPLEGKLGAVIITGDSDGVEHVTGNISNFFTCMGITVPPYSSLGVMWESHGKKKKTPKSKLLKYYEKEYAKDAEAMAESLSK